MIKIKKLNWDTWNIEHITKHKLTPQEVELAIKDKNRNFKNGHSNRLIVLGKSNKRLVAIVLSEESKGHYYVITARDMDKKERNIYRKEVKNEKK